MGRFALVRSSGRALKEKKNRKQLKQLNASLPEQLVLDFNDAAKEHGRDVLLKNVMLSYLEKVLPESKSVRAHRTEQEAAERRKLVSQAKASKLHRDVSVRDALRLSRELAEEIVDVTSDLGRKDPKRAPQREKILRKRRA